MAAAAGRKSRPSARGPGRLPVCSGRHIARDLRPAPYRKCLRALSWQRCGLLRSVRPRRGSGPARPSLSLLGAAFTPSTNKPQLKSLDRSGLKMRERLLLLLCALARRRGMAGRWDGPQRRAWLRYYYSQRQKRLMTLLIARRRRTSCYFYPRAWPSLRGADWWERVVLKEFGPQDWLEKFRMTRETFFYVCNRLRPGLAPHSAHFHPTLPLEKRVAVALWHLASNVEYQTLSPLFGVGPSTVQTCVREVSYAVVLLLKPLYLRLPDEKELENMVRIFRTRWGFPHCIGALDSLHIPINPPPRLSADYCNGQGWHSILTQATVDGLGQFWDVSTAFPGSMENSAVLESSSLWVLAKEGRLCPNPPKDFMGKAQKYVLLGDATYPLRDWILKPYREDGSLTRRQLRFNYRLKRAHSVIENAFLRLKARWQILLKCDDCSLELLPTLVLACCVLHNVCEAHDNPFNQDWLEGAEPTELPRPCQPAPTAMEDGRAEQVRELMCQYFESCGDG
ncbi:protein ANTAGONIST OF LIKE HETEROCHROMATIN PROTEIN 1-like [Coturnix japonica]|nr:protein ANTAGONIST OF LIKE HETEROCHROMATIN PROTEIN 1-like [Coturnix japonica]